MTTADRTSVLVRFPPEVLGRIADWSEAQALQGHALTRHAAILELIEIGLGFDPEVLAAARQIIEFRERLAREIAAFQDACVAAGERMKELLNE